MLYWVMVIARIAYFMKGIIFTEFLSLVEEKFGLEQLDAILDEAQDSGIYTSVGSYDHKNLVKLIVILSKQTGISPEEVVSNSDLCINGTTVGLNALITHNGAKTGLIATAIEPASKHTNPPTLPTDPYGHRPDPETPLET